MQETTINIIHTYSYFHLFGLVFIYFLFLYLALAPAFQGVCRFLEKKNLISKIVEKEITPQQIRYEIRHSLVSIVIFGFSALPVVYLIRIGAITILEDTFLNIITGIALLTLWNEIHFFVIHRIMHLPFFMRNVHFIHHRSKIPSVYSVYSFHWFEALLLSSVPLTIAPFIAFAPQAFIFFPLVSVLLNYSGHCNFRFGNGTGKRWKLFATHHNEHHFKRRKNYGFASGLIDDLYIKLINKKVNKNN